MERILGEQSTSDVPISREPNVPIFSWYRTRPLVLFLTLLLLLPHLVYAETVSGDGQIAAPIRLDEAGLQMKRPRRLRRSIRFEPVRGH